MITYKQQVEAIIDRIAPKNSPDKSMAVEGLITILRSASERSEELCRQLHQLLGNETALTIPLSDGSVAKVKFSGNVTQPNLLAFARIFQSIADNYVIEQGGSAHTSGANERT